MSDSLAHYAFLPWMKQGIGAKITEKDALGTNNGTALERATLNVELNIESTNIGEGGTFNTPVGKTMKLQGPPDVLGVSSRAIVRTEPKARVNNYQANGLPYIEFYREDFLWTYTPAVADVADKGKLTPWLALICLKDDEFTLNTTNDGRTFITISSDSEGGIPIIDRVFHSEKQHWAWGHVHLNTELETAGAGGKVTNVLVNHENEVNFELDNDPDTGVCRLICPRKLVKETQYTAFLIPAFETGRLAGLALPYMGVKAQKMSWEIGDDYTAKASGYNFPVYHNWTFRTGLYGDFESLARILKPVVTGPELGKRDMYIADPGYGLDETLPESSVLGLEGALKPPGFVSDAWTNNTTHNNNYREHLRKLLNLSIDNESRFTDNNSPNADSLAVNPFYSATLGDDPIVTPHIYGRWHGLVNRLRTTGDTNQPWVNDINLDPRNRASAGLGVTVVQKNQEEFMRRSWKQVEEVNEANKKIKKAALSQLISQAIYTKHVKNANNDMLVQLTNPLHKFVLDGDKTIENNFTKSLVPNASKAAAFRKITRPGKKSNRAVNKIASDNGKSLLHAGVVGNFNAGNITAAVDKAAPITAIVGTLISSAIQASTTAFEANNTAMATQAVFQALASEADFDVLDTRKAELKTKINNNAALNAAQRTLAKDLFDGILSSTAGSDSKSKLVDFEIIPYKALFGEDITAKYYLDIILTRDTEGMAGQLSRATSLDDLNAFSGAFVGFTTDVLDNLADIPKGEVLTPVGDLSQTLVRSLQPKSLLLDRLNYAITIKIYNPITQAYDTQALNRLKPVMAYPKIDDPMFRSLKKLSQEYILPNIDKVPNNSITLLEVNQAFIEAYMAGLNHEMSRELLWREFPTDQRGTYFRQFWDVSDNLTEEDPEKKYDIKKIPEWTSDLGTHTPRVLTNPTDSPYLVLLIRGDILKKYPNTQVYAHKAAFKVPANPAVPREFADDSNPDNIKVPAFMAELDPDIYLFGFDLDIDEAKGFIPEDGELGAPDPGWFFVLRERPGQINFGLDDWTPENDSVPDLPDSDPTDWNDLSWEHMTTPDGLLNYQLDANHSFTPGTGGPDAPNAEWGKNSADLAYILYQNPVIFARHAQEMLPED